MLGFFRRIVHSRVGIVVTFVVLILIALAFGLSDVSGLRSGAGGLGGGTLATVGQTAIGEIEVRRVAQNELQNARQQNPALDMTQFIAAGGFDGVLDRLITGVAMEQFGHDQGMVIGKQLVDRQITAIPALQGIDGKFDQVRYDRLLAEQKLTDAFVRGDIARGMIAQQLILPTIGATQIPQQLATAYAALLLEKRNGQIAFIPTQAAGQGAPPSDAEVQDWYRRNVARYSLPERRVVRYALVTPETVKARATPSDAEIAQAYAATKAKYQPTEKRTLTQVTVLDQGAANALAARVKAGTALADAARAAGLEPRTVKAVDKAGYAAQTNPAVADAAFAAARGATIGPVRGTIGFVVAKVEAVEQVPGRTLAEARDEIAAELTKQKTGEAIAAVQDAIGDALDKDANFSEIAADQKLQPQVTPALTATGADPRDPTKKPDVATGQIVAAGFAAAEGDAPVVVQTAADGSFALIALDKIVPGAPRPLGEIRDAVARDFVIDRAKKAARAVAVKVVAQLAKRVALAQALAATGLKLPPIREIAAPRSELATNPQGAPASLALLFSMAPGTAKMLEAPQNGGWIIVKLDSIERGDASTKPDLIRATRTELGKAIGQEYAQQFAAAVRKSVKVTRNDAAIAKAKADLTGQGGSNP